MTNPGSNTADTTTGTAPEPRGEEPGAPHHIPGVPVGEGPIRHAGVAALIGVSTFSSIGALVAHLPGVLPMSLGGIGLLIGTGIVVGCAAWARVRDPALWDRLVRGFWGGLVGTLGYDIFRIPFHGSGMNVFAPIDAYGMWLLGAVQSSPTTDLVGFTYHVSNGIAFGIAYSLVVGRRTWVLGLIWGLALEAFAILSPFGAVFSLRGYSGTVLLAFAAHVFYGVPLGLVCERLDVLDPPGRRRGGAMALGALVVVSIGFLVRDGAARSRPSPQTDAIRFESGGLTPGWSDRRVGDAVPLVLAGETPQKVLVRTPESGPKRVSSRDLVPGVPVLFPLDRPGLYQFGVDDGRRSVFVSVHRGGDYRPIRDPSGSP